MISHAYMKMFLQYLVLLAYSSVTEFCFELATLIADQHMVIAECDLVT